MVSERSLYYWYRYFNRKYFRNRLPKDIEISFADPRSFGHDLAQCYTDDTIEINARIRWSLVLVKGSLLHEMIHLSLPKNAQHGPRWKRKVKKLFLMGAFDRLV